MKYSLKLEQIVNHDTLGEIIINLQYDATGIKMLDLDIEDLADADRNILHPIMALVNLSLAKGVQKDDLVEQVSFQAEMTDGTVQSVLNLVAETLIEIPSTIGAILPETLFTITPEFVKEYMKSHKLS